jgi:hypothetical protein
MNQQIVCGYESILVDHVRNMRQSTSTDDSIHGVHSNREITQSKYTFDHQYM